MASWVDAICHPRVVRSMGFVFSWFWHDVIGKLRRGYVVAFIYVINNSIDLDDGLI